MLKTKAERDKAQSKATTGREWQHKVYIKVESYIYQNRGVKSAIAALD